MRQLLKSSNFLRSFWRRMTSQDNIVAVCQITAKNNKEDNLKTCTNLIEKASQQGAKFVFLPEACDFIGESKLQTLELAEPLDGPVVSAYRDLAKRFCVWLSLGGLHEKTSSEKIRNAHVVINSEGEIVAVYHKTHLFDVEIPDKGIILKESEYVQQGKEIIPPVCSPVGSVGLCICYDLRFPELSLVLRGMGADILTFPSAFTQSTGAAHWEVLLRARAIETQCYVIAAAQIGMHNPKRSSWGHAMIVDPWGTVIAQCSEGVNFALAVIDHTLLKNMKDNMPIWNHRRYDLYPQLTRKTDRNVNTDEFKEPYQFGNSVIKTGQIFYETNITMAFTNRRCVLPGHVLVAPKRCAKRLNELTPEEVSDLFQTVTNVQKVVENSFCTNSSTVCVQDGVYAGQTVEHVHVHVIPRKNGDFQRNDDIYDVLQQNDTESSFRAESEMFNEATMLRKNFI